MAYNPYAPPEAPAAPGHLSRANYASGPQPWGVSEVLSAAWTVVKAHWAPLIFGTLIAGAAQAIPQQAITFGWALASHGGSSTGTFAGGVGGASSSFGGVLGACVGIAVGAFFSGGLVKLHLAAARGQTPDLADLFRGGKYFLPMLGGMLLFVPGGALGGLFFLIPGIIWTCGTFFYSYFIADQDLGAVDALKASWEATRGHKGKVFLLFLASVPLVMLGVLACCVGYLPAAATIQVAVAIVYTRVTGRMNSPQYGGFSAGNTAT